MMLLKRVFSYTFLFLFSSHLLFSLEVKERMVADLEIVKNAFEVKYAPLDLKKERFGWDLDQEIGKAKKKILGLSSPQESDFHKVLFEFFRSSHDFTSNVVFSLTESAFLPFFVTKMNGRYFVDCVLEENYPIKVGDEILTFAGEPISQVVERLRIQRFGEDDSNIANALATLDLTMKLAAYGDEVPQGKVMIEVRRFEEKWWALSSGKEEKIMTHQCEWDYKPEKMTHAAYIEPKMKQNRSLLNDFSLIFPKKCSFPRRAQDQLTLMAEEGRLSSDASMLYSESKKCLHTPKNINWKTGPNSAFNACLFESGNNTFAYLKIPHFAGSALEVREFKKLIAKLEAESDALVIDLKEAFPYSNWYMCALLSYLTDSPLLLPLEQRTVTHQEALSAVNTLELFDELWWANPQQLLGEELDGYPVNEALLTSIKSYFNFIVNEWKEGKRMTDLFPSFGVSQIKPSVSTRYTKPILLYVDALTEVDLFLAIMKDNKRAQIMGVQTFGVEGEVQFVTYPNRFGVSGFTLKNALTYRLDGRPIEDEGVKPDFPLSLKGETLEEINEEIDQAIIQTLHGLVSVITK